MLWNVFISITIPILTIGWIWKDPKIVEFVTLEIRVLATFILVCTLFIGIVTSVYQGSKQNEN